MKIKINGQICVVNSDIRLRELLTTMKIDAQRYMIMVNNQSVMQGYFDTFILYEGDRIDYELRVTGIPQISPNFTNFP